MYRILSDASELNGKQIKKVFECAAGVLIFITTDKCVLGLEPGESYGLGEMKIIENVDSYLLSKNSCLYDEIKLLNIFDNEDFKTYENKEKEEYERLTERNRKMQYQQYLGYKKQFESE